MSPPRFAVVGHPNKGKSSLVATLAEDESVRIAPESGTTTRAVTYPMRVRGETLYELIDTPGFQRARRALGLIEQRAATAAARREAVRAFVAEHRADPMFRAECELLAPVVEGAGIIYVVDGAVPYGPEYEPEMEILRWSGQPSLAVINPIGTRDHVREWRDALGQYFRVVREMDVLAAPVEQRLDLLRAFGELDPAWRPALERAVEALRAERHRLRVRAARVIAEMLVEALTLAPERRLRADDDPQAARAELEHAYADSLRGLETAARARVERLYHHEALARDEAVLESIEADLLAARTWQLFGLDRLTLAGVGAGGGAAAGLGVDAALGGLSGFLGAAIGGVAGGAAAWLAADRLARFETRDLPFGEQVLAVRAGASRNLPFVLLGRARVHHALVARRSHARRDPLVVEGTSAGLPGDARQRLARLFERAADAGDDGAEAVVESLAEAIAPLLESEPEPAA
ncbi:MAG: GTPase and DUF3482 domain-containing protein [Ectothiorhodospiraceae bacterium]|nr:GTPase and DUF3482 domain-containing protein [Ectothiorhodospiraceae bacterium]